MKAQNNIVLRNENVFHPSLDFINKEYVTAGLSHPLFSFWTLEIIRNLQLLSSHPSVEG